MPSITHHAYFRKNSGIDDSPALRTPQIKHLLYDITDALTAQTTCPLLKLIHSTNTPNNCHLEANLVPEPSLHLKLFVVASIPIHPIPP